MVHKVRQDSEIQRQVISQLRVDISDVEDKLYSEIRDVQSKITEHGNKFEEIARKDQEKKNIVNIPTVTAFNTVDGKKSLDEDAILDAFEKLREFIAYESKRHKEDLVKINL